MVFAEDRLTDEINRVFASVTCGGTVCCSGFHEAKYDFRAIQNYFEKEGNALGFTNKARLSLLSQRMSSSASRNSWGMRGPATRASST